MHKNKYINNTINKSVINLTKKHYNRLKDKLKKFYYGGNKPVAEYLPLAFAGREQKQDNGGIRQKVELLFFFGFISRLVFFISLSGRVVHAIQTILEIFHSFS